MPFIGQLGVLFGEQFLPQHRSFLHVPFGLLVASTAFHGAQPVGNRVIDLVAFLVRDSAMLQLPVQIAQGQGHHALAVPSLDPEYLLKLLEMPRRQSRLRGERATVPEESGCLFAKSWKIDGSVLDLSISLGTILGTGVSVTESVRAEG